MALSEQTDNTYFETPLTVILIFLGSALLIAVFTLFGLCICRHQRKQNERASISLESIAEKQERVRNNFGCCFQSRISKQRKEEFLSTRPLSVNISRPTQIQTNSFNEVDSVTQVQNSYADQHSPNATITIPKTIIPSPSRPQLSMTPMSEILAIPCLPSTSFTRRTNTQNSRFTQCSSTLHHVIIHDHQSQTRTLQVKMNPRVGGLANPQSPHLKVCRTPNPLDTMVMAMMSQAMMLLNYIHVYSRILELIIDYRRQYRKELPLKLSW
ncbi:hypothetical protein HK096_005909 [Nowakowskiella sp. JEL0078]|nr:hypothetical protein HK096_005909 [Nowakowskiella sp. JEL0078]